jgi:hypothetical protein
VDHRTEPADLGGAYLVLLRGAVQLRRPLGHTIATAARAAVTPQADSADGIAWNGGPHAWLAVQRHSAGHYLRRLSVSGNSIEPDGQTIEGGASPALSPAGDRLAYVRDPDLVTRDTRTGEERRVSLTRSPVQLAWSADGARLAVVATSPYSGFVVDATSGRVRDVLVPNQPPGSQLGSLAWRGDQLVAAITCCGDFPHEPRIVDATTGAVLTAPSGVCPPVGVGKADPTSSSVLWQGRYCVIDGLFADRADRASLFYVFEGRLYRWSGASPARVADGISAVA